MTQETKKRSDIKREQILKVAGELFIKHGFGNVTMDAIADAAPVSKPTLYNHFENKAALFFAVMGNKTDTLFKTLEDALRTDLSTRETLIEIGNRFLDVILKTEAISMYRIMIAEGAHFPELGQIFYQTGPQRVCGLIAAYLKKEHDAGNLNIPNPELSASIFVNMLKGNGHMQCLMLIKDKIPPKERAETVDYVVNIFLDGHAPNAK